MKRSFAFLCSLAICLGILTSSYCAIEIEPKHVLIDVDGLSSPPTVDFGGMQLYLIGKDNDDTSLCEGYFSQMYYAVQDGTGWPVNYSGPSEYLVLTIHANGLGGIGTYEAGIIGYQIDGTDFEVAVPEFTLTSSAAYFSLYIASDGSTYYARSDHMPTSQGGMIDDLLDLSVDLTPSQALVEQHLAAQIPEPSSLGLVMFPACWAVFAMRRKWSSRV